MGRFQTGTGLQDSVFSLTDLFQAIYVDSTYINSCIQALKHKNDLSMINPIQAEVVGVPLLLGLCKQAKSEGNKSTC